MTDALETAGHTVTAVGIDRGGGWTLADPNRRPMAAEGPSVSLSIPSGTLRTPGGPVEFDVVFPVLHGPYGEDGTIQGALEMAAVPYVGSGVLGSAVGMDKDFAKRLFRDAGLPVADHQVVGRRDWDESPGSVVARLVARLGLPVFVKPAALGSSVGVAKAASDHEAKQAIEDAFRYGGKVVVEEAVAAREIEVGVLDGPRVSAPGEIVIEADWYDYSAKYEDETSRFVTPADLSPAETEQARHLAAAAFTALELRGPTRVDFLFEEGRRGFLVNEVNTMPGFTPISGFPQMWMASGMTYAELCDDLVRSALG